MSMSRLSSRRTALFLLLCARADALLPGTSTVRRAARPRRSGWSLEAAGGDDRGASGDGEKATTTLTKAAWVGAELLGKAASAARTLSEPSGDGEGPTSAALEAPSTREEARRSLTLEDMIRPAVARASETRRFIDVDAATHAHVPRPSSPLRVRRHRPSERTAPRLASSFAPRRGSRSARAPSGNFQQ